MLKVRWFCVRFCEPLLASAGYLLGLPEAVDSTSGLSLERAVEAWLHQNHLGCRGQRDANGGSRVGRDANCCPSRTWHALELSNQPVAHGNRRLLVERVDGVCVDLLAVERLHHRLLDLIELGEDDNACEWVGSAQAAQLGQKRLHLYPFCSLPHLLHRTHSHEPIVGCQRLGRVRPSRHRSGATAGRRLLPRALVAGLSEVVGAAAQPCLDAAAQGGWLLADPRPRELWVEPVGHTITAGGKVIERALIPRHIEQYGLERSLGQCERDVPVYALRPVTHRCPHSAQCRGRGRAKRRIWIRAMVRHLAWRIIRRLRSSTMRSVSWRLPSARPSEPWPRSAS